MRLRLLYSFRPWVYADVVVAGLAWENLQITFERLPTIAAAFAQYRAGEISYDAFKYLALDYVLHRGGPVLPLDGLVFGPDGFHNEPFFGPSLVLPTRKLRVFTLMLLRNMFDTDTLMHTVFPVSLQSDVELGAIYLRDALIRLRPKRIFFGDSVAILMTSKLAKKLYDFPERTGLEQAVLRILEDSMEFPPTYPPVGLSKLVPGREAYSPAEVVWSEDDGMRTVGPNMSAVQAAWDQLGGLGTVVVLKREYTEGGRGVSMILRQSDLAAGLEKVYERTGGVGLIDLDLKVRLFLQKEVPITNFIPAVFRFYAHRGQLIAGHLSRVEVATRFGGIGFVTLRDELSEQKAVEFIRLRNYTGFGTLKYWVGKGETWQLDFNPRFERQSCISGILIEKYGNSENAEERALVNKDPCAVFQLWSTGHKFQDCELPIILPAGIRFMDAMRVANLGMVPLAKDFIDMLTGGRYVWNLHRGDASCFRLHQNYLNNYVRDWKNQFEKQ